MAKTKGAELRPLCATFSRILPASWRLTVANSEGFIRIVNNFGWLLFEQILRLGLGLLIGAWLARYLGPAQFGDLSSILAVVSIFQFLSQLGINNIVVRDLAGSREPSAEIIGTAFLLRIASGFLCFMGATSSMVLIRPGDIQSIVLTAIIASSLVFQSSDVVDLWFQSKLQSKNSALAKIFASIISNSIKVAFILLKLPLIAFAIILLLESIILSLTLIYLCKRDHEFEFGFFSISRCKKILKEGWPFLIAGVILVAYTQIDKILLEKLSLVSEVGYYVAATTIAGVINFLPTILCSSLAPRLAKISDDESKNDFFIKLNAFLFWGGMICTIFINVSAKYTVLLLYGSRYESSVLLTEVLGLTIIPIFLSVANDYLALSRRDSRATLIRVALGFIISLALNFALIPIYGALGAAIASLVAHWFSNTILYWIIMEGSYNLQIRAIVFPFIFSFNKYKQHNQYSK